MTDEEYQHYLDFMKKLKFLPYPKKFLEDNEERNDPIRQIHKEIEKEIFTNIAKGSNNEKE